MNAAIKKLVQYGIEKQLITPYDKIYITNSLLELFQMDQYVEPEEEYTDICLEEVLDAMLNYAYEKGLLEENSTTYRDLFDTKIMATLIPKPGEIIGRFQNYYKESPKKATDYYYTLSQNTDYIRKYRIVKDMKWTTDTEYGTMDITINLSKPEKDPKAIAAAKFAKQNGYPKCLLCRENEGYAGRINHPARQNHRIIPICINGQNWGFQYSPYVYYNE